MLFLLLIGDAGGTRTPNGFTHSGFQDRQTTNYHTAPFVAAPARFELTSEGVKDLCTTIALRGYCGAPDRTRTCKLSGS